MDARLAAPLRATTAGRLAEEILRQCVHCGFCNATCPTYQALGDELDGPRGRIYLIKEMLEGRAVSAKTRQHLDRCLTCRACETTCPSGVRYSQLLAIGRTEIERRLKRPLRQALPRALLKALLPRRNLFAGAVAVGRLLRPLLPRRLAEQLPARPTAAGPWPTPRGRQRRMLLLTGCVQPALAPNIDAAAARLLDRLGIELIREPRAGCCGAIRHHLGDAAALADMRRNIDAWWPHLAAGVEAIVVTASGCGVQVRDYGHLLAADGEYADKAARVSALC
ncbi:MAG: glycolate oxidase subunit GlcF, partial [Desulfobulbus sp.]|nr:glycolate oxidase subunit GlcF [Desulfobulbus sp.]